MPHPCSAEGDRVRRIIIGVDCVWWERTVANLVYYNGDMQKRERGDGYGLALNGQGATSGHVTMRVI